MRKRWIVAAVALLAALIVGATAANAATLGVTTKKEVTLTKLQRCAASMNGTTPVVKTTPASGTTITVSALPAACAGLSLKINLHNDSGTVIATGTTASAAATQTVTVGTYASANVSAAIATIGGWIFPTSWNGAAPVTPGCVGLDASGNATSQSCTLTIGTVATWTANGHQYSQFQFSAVTSAALWKVTFNFADTAKWAGFTPTVVVNNQNVALASGYSCSSLPIFQGVEANPGWGSANGDLIITNDPSYGGNKLCG
ncbi:MAG: hypothetical protein NVV57_03410 [Demequina sp.]|nr:hypothetical protein [Demequina sp.]